jgi:hypothetical protein
MALAIVDSGADDTLFPMYVACGLGLVAVGENPETMRGLTGSVARYTDGM